mgnify:CR=1 FL=1
MKNRKKNRDLRRIRPGYYSDTKPQPVGTRSTRSDGAPVYRAYPRSAIPTSRYPSTPESRRTDKGRHLAKKACRAYELSRP